MTKQRISFIDEFANGRTRGEIACTIDKLRDLIIARGIPGDAEIGYVGCGSHDIEITWETPDDPRS